MLICDRCKGTEDDVQCVVFNVDRIEDRAANASKVGGNRSDWMDFAVDLCGKCRNVVWQELHVWLKGESPSHARINTPVYTLAPHASGAKADDND